MRTISVGWRLLGFKRLLLYCSWLQNNFALSISTYSKFLLMFHNCLGSIQSIPRTLYEGCERKKDISVCFVCPSTNRNLKRGLHVDPGLIRRNGGSGVLDGTLFRLRNKPFQSADCEPLPALTRSQTANKMSHWCASRPWYSAFYYDPSNDTFQTDLVYLMPLFIRFLPDYPNLGTAKLYWKICLL